MGSLTEVQRSIIIGSLLGDGSMRCKTNALLEINHSIRQRSYVDWKYRHLADLVLTAPKRRPGNGGRIAYRFVTRSLPELTSIYRLFYQNGVKTIPEVVLTPMGLAVWFMDDGSKSRSAVYLNTQQFSPEAQFRLIALLREQWGIQSALNRDKTYHRIRVKVGSVSRLIEVVEPYIRPEFRYKLPQVTP